MRNVCSLAACAWKREGIDSGLQSELASFGENQALLLWAYERALEILSPISRGELAEPVTDQAPSRTLAIESLLAALFCGSPIVEQEEPSSVGWSELLKPPSIGADGNSSQWRVERAAELEKFNLSRKYCEQLPLLERAKFESWLDDKQRRATNEILEFIDLAQSTAMNSILLTTSKSSGCISNRREQSSTNSPKSLKFES